VRKNILITDVVKELSVEKKVLSNYNLTLKKIDHLSKKERKDISGILTGHEINFNTDLLSKFPKCKVIVRYGTGYNNIDIEAAKKRRIKVFNVPDYGSKEVADVAIAMTMSSVKNLNTFYFNILNKNKKNYWKYNSGLIHKRLSKLSVGVIGLGRIGSSFATRAKLLGFNINFYDPYLKRYPKKFKKRNSLKKLFQSSDIISLHVPLTKKTKFFITRNLINESKKRLILINTARGELIRESTILESLKKNKILFYGADVLEYEPIKFNSKIFKLMKDKKFSSRILVTPHSAFYTEESYYDLRFNASITMLNYLKYKSLKNCVNK
jgi:lactate dehydrogenase-like 2-hydroxyacid dehydrogenase